MSRPLHKSKAPLLNNFLEAKLDSVQAWYPRQKLRKQCALRLLRERSGARTHEFPWREWPIETNQISRTECNSKQETAIRNAKRYIHYVRLPPHGKIGVDSIASTDTLKNTVYEQAQNNRHRKRQKQSDKRNEKCMQQWKAQKQPEVSYHIKTRGYRMRAAGVISMCSCWNEEKCYAAEIRWVRERSFRRGKVRQKRENRGKSCRLHGKCRKCRWKSDSDDVETG